MLYVCLNQSLICGSLNYFELKKKIMNVDEHDGLGGVAAHGLRSEYGDFLLRNNGDKVLRSIIRLIIDPHVFARFSFWISCILNRRF